MSLKHPGPPTLAGFQAFIRDIMQIPVISLPSDAPVICYVFQFSLDTVLRAICVASPLVYNTAVYNLAGDLLINLAPDTAVTPDYFKGLREKFKCGQFASGVVTNASDEATSAGIEVIENLQNLTIDQLQNLKTPYGRIYLGIAMKFGTMWGIT
jgi:hypothetical protein